MRDVGSDILLVSDNADFISLSGKLKCITSECKYSRKWRVYTRRHRELVFFCKKTSDNLPLK